MATSSGIKRARGTGAGRTGLLGPGPPSLFSFVLRTAGARGSDAPTQEGPPTATQAGRVRFIVLRQNRSPGVGRGAARCPRSGLDRRARPRALPWRRPQSRTRFAPSCAVESDVAGSEADLRAGSRGDGPSPPQRPGRPGQVHTQLTRLQTGLEIASEHRFSSKRGEKTGGRMEGLVGEQVAVAPTGRWSRSGLWRLLTIFKIAGAAGYYSYFLTN